MISFLLSTPVESCSGNVDKNSFLNLFKKLSITLSGSLKLTKSWIEFTGLGLYVSILALAFDVWPIINSSSKNLSWADIIILSVLTNRIVASAPEIEPLTISPCVNLPNGLSSYITLSPASTCVLAVPRLPASSNNKFSWLVSVSNNIPSVLSMSYKVD